MTCFVHGTLCRPTTTGLAIQRLCHILQNRTLCNVQVRDAHNDNPRYHNEPEKNRPRQFVQPVGHRVFRRWIDGHRDHSDKDADDRSQHNDDDGLLDLHIGRGICRETREIGRVLTKQIKQTDRQTDRQK